MPPANDEPFAAQNPAQRGRGGRMFNINIGGRQTNTQSIGSGIAFDMPGMNKLTKDIAGLEAALQHFRKTVGDVGQFLSSQGRNAMISPVQQMTDSYKNLTRAINEAVLAANNAKGIVGGSGAGGGGYNAATMSSDPNVSSRATGGMPTSSNAVSNGGGGSGGARSWMNDVGGKTIGLSQASGTAETAAAAAGGASAGSTLAASGGPAAIGGLAFAKVLQAGYNLFQDSRSASILMADVLGPTATLAQTTIRQLIGTLAQNLAAYGPLTEQLSAINIGTQIGAGIPGGQAPDRMSGIASEAKGAMTGLLHSFLVGEKFVKSAVSNAAHIVGIGGGTKVQDIPGKLAQNTGAGSQALIDKYSLADPRPSSAEATNAVTRRTGGFYEGVREMQAITPGVGAGQIASQFAAYIGDTGAQQRGQVLGQGAFTSFGQGAQIKSFSDWAKAVTEFFKRQRPGSSQGKNFTYAELVSQNFPGSNINAWFAQMGVPQGLVFYWWQYAISQASKEGDSPFIDTLAKQRGDDLSAKRLQTLSFMGQQDLTLSYSAGYSAALTAEGVAQTSARGKNWVARELGSLLNVTGISGAFGAVGGLLGLGHAAGGTAYKGQPTRTSELGPEVFVPQQTGEFVTASKTRRLDALLERNDVGGGGGPVMIFNTTIQMGGNTSPIQAKQAATVLADHHEAEMKKRLTRMTG